MNFFYHARLVCLLATIGFSSGAQAESFASSASSAGSAGSASLGSVSDSLTTSSDSASDSSTDDDQTASGDYRITDMAQAPGRDGFLRITLQAEESRQRMVLDLPEAVIENQGLTRGDLVHTQKRAYGMEFAHADTREAFYLVLADEWHGELAARPIAEL